jgi:hypothetical protein
MNPDERLNDLFRAARKAPAPEGRDLGFETQLLARLRDEQRGGLGMLAWKFLPYFAAVTLVAAIWYAATPQPEAVDLLAFQWEEQELAALLN